MTEVKGLERYLARLKRIPEDVQVAVEAQLHKNGDDLVAAIQRNAPVDERETHPGQLRESVRWYPVSGRRLSIRVIADAKDEAGHPYPAHVEFGHGKEGGGHVPARPFFFPMYRALRRRLKTRLSTAARKAIKTL